MLGDQPKLQDQPKRRAPEARLERLERKLERDNVVRPRAALKRGPEQIEARQKLRSEIRQRRFDLQVKLQEARLQLMAAASEPNVNEGALRKRANRVGQLEAELALLKARVGREARLRFAR